MASRDQRDQTGPQQLLEELRKVQRSEASLSDVLGLHPDVLAQLVRRAQGMIDQGQLEDAEELLEDIDRVENRIPNVPFLLGVCRFEAGRFAAAIEAFSQAAKLGTLAASDDFMQQVYLCRAQARLQSGDVDKASEDLSRASERGDQELAQSARALLAQLEATRAEG